MPDPLAEAFRDVAPEVDVDASRVLFERRVQRRRRRAAVVRTGGAALAAVVAVLGVTMLDDGRDRGDVAVVAGPGEEEDLAFEVLATSDAPLEEAGTLRTAVTDDELNVLWRQLGQDGDTPAVDLDEQVVVSMTVADDGCSQHVVAIDRRGDLLTPVFAEPPAACDRAPFALAFVVALDRSALTPGATLRLPASETRDDRERRLRVLDEGGDDDRGPAFEVLWVGRSGERLGTLRPVEDRRELEGLWHAMGQDGEPPPVDLDEQVVVSITVPDDACPPDLTGFERGGELLTPVFEETAEVCDQPRVARGFVVAFDRSSLPPGAALRLPANPSYGVGERRLRLDVDR